MHASDRLQILMAVGSGCLHGDLVMSHFWPDTSGPSVLAFNESSVSIRGQAACVNASICSHLPSYLSDFPAVSPPKFLILCLEQMA